MIRIGVLVPDFENLKNWELRIIKNIIDDPELELSVLIKDGRADKNQNRKSLSKHVIGKTLFNLQTKLERRSFHGKLFPERTEIIEKLSSFPSISLTPTRKGEIDIFTPKDSQKVKDFNLDIILKHEFAILDGSILYTSKFGVWSFYFGNFSAKDGVQSSLLGNILKNPNIEVTLQQLTPELENSLVIDKGYFNKKRSFITTYEVVTNASIPILFKNIELIKRGKYCPERVSIYHNTDNTSPDLYSAAQYIWRFYGHLSHRLFEKINSKILNVKYDCWTLLIGEGNFMDTPLESLKPVKLPKDEFWADPFFLKHNGEFYIFFENFSYTTKLGKISCGRLQNDELVDVCDVLDFNYHLSYPFVFKEGADIFLMPETGSNKRLEIYRCVEFPKKWELYKTAFEGEMVLDAHFYRDDKNQKWLFINKMSDSSPYDSELYIYRVDSIKMDKIEPHRQNPIIINSKTARNGGAIFKYKDEIYRPSQYNADGIYGRGLNINKIKKLTIKNYIEENVITYMPNFRKGFNAMHHLHQIDGHFVIDAAYKKKRSKKKV